MSSPYYPKFKYELKYSAGFVANLEYELEHIKSVFEKNKIEYILLKGSVLRNYYPEPWMRTSCDIDILVHDEQLDKAVKVLTQTGYRVEGNKHYHDLICTLRAVCTLSFIIILKNVKKKWIRFWMRYGNIQLS